MTRQLLTQVAAGGAPVVAREQGLSSDEIEQRQVRGELNTVPTGTSRSVVSILASNAFTRFNVLLGVLLVAILVIGPFRTPSSGWCCS